MALRPPNTNHPPWLWLAALTPMILGGIALIAIFSFINIRTSPDLTAAVALTATRAAAHTQARTLTSVAQLPYTAAAYNNTALAGLDRANQRATQARNLTATATANFYQTATSRSLTTTNGPQAFLRLIQFSLAFSDTFDAANPLWLTNTTNATVSNGKYKWQLSGNAPQWASAAMKPASKFYFAAKARVIKDSTNAQYGLLFRHMDNDFYAFTISNAQTYTVLRYTNHQPQVLTQAPVNGKALNVFEVNQLAVFGDGPNYSFYVNEKFVASVTDTQLQGTGFGLMTHLLEATDEAALEFDEVEFRLAPDKGSPTATPLPSLTPTR